MALVEVQPARWDPLLRDLGVGDVYYSRGYVEASAPLAGGTPVFLWDGDAGVFAAVLRPDPCDVVTPYGYGGPIASDLAAFGAAYEGWAAERGVVSTFVVFHPLLANHAGSPVHVTPLAGTVAWRLEGDLEAAMHRHHRRLVRRARERFEVSFAQDVGPFVSMYEATMRRRDAHAFYFFDDAYWRALASGVALVRVDVGGVASVLGMGEPPYLHYHLGAATDEARGTGASHLALLALAEWGRDHGYATLHLGGGVGGSDDSLLQYKRRFCPSGLVPSFIGKAVHDAAAYEALAGAPADLDAFFPAYRRPR